MVTMFATVVQAWGSQVLVRDQSNNQEVLVHTNHSTSNLAAGDVVRIVYNGVMTASIPPQINSQSICNYTTARTTFGPKTPAEKFSFSAGVSYFTFSGSRRPERPPPPVPLPYNTRGCRGQRRWR